MSNFQGRRLKLFEEHITMNVNEALASLDPADDELWTGDGMPRIDVIQDLTKNRKLTRAMITDAAPQFTRQPAIDAQTELPNEPAEDKNDVSTSTAPEQAATPAEEVTHAKEAEKATPAEEVIAEDVMVEAAMPHEPMPEIVPLPGASLSALQEQLAIHTETMTKAQIVKVEADKAAKAASDQVNALNRRIDAITKADPGAATRGIRDYIKSQNEQRILRAGRVRKFLGDTGVNVKDVAKSLEIRSPLDRAMHGRKPPRGSQRPVMHGQG